MSKPLSRKLADAVRRHFAAADADLLETLPDVEAAARRQGSEFAQVLSYAIAALVAIFVLWASFATLDEVTRGDGQVIPSSRIQVVQNLEGGILSDIAVREGAIVQKGDVLLRIDNSAAQSNYRDARSQYLTHLAAIARLEAEVNDKAVQWPKEIAAESPETIADQRRLYDNRKNQLAAQLSAMKSQVDQRRQEIAELRGRETQLRRNLKLATQQRDIAKPLATQGIYPRVDFLKLERDVSTLEGDLQATELGLPRTENALREAQSRVTEQEAAFRSQAAEELNKRRQEAQSLYQAITTGYDRVNRTEVRSPVRGTVKQIRQTTVGGVIKPGEDILEIVPLDDTLLIEARVRPADIAFLRPGQPAMVKITAYDFSVYGGLKAKLEEISADTIKDDKGESFFRIRLRTNVNTLTQNGQPLPIIPGMTASVDILTGEKTVMDYLLKPILRIRDRALRER
jgi:membrane fusion protein, adhesin transport system